MRGDEVRCEYCGGLVEKSFNPQKNNNAEAMVFHHVIPLNSLNVNDAVIAINPANIQILHWRCHNKVHGRFEGSTRRSDQKVYLITGAPCSGKTTLAREIMSAGDVIIDIDDIWQQVTGLPRYSKPNAAKPIVFATLKAQEEQIRMRAGNWYNAFIIKSLPLRMDRERTAQALNADEVIVMNATREDCLGRLHENPNGRNVNEYEGYINQYYQRFVGEQTP